MTKGELKRSTNGTRQILKSWQQGMQNTSCRGRLALPCPKNHVKPVLLQDCEGYWRSGRRKGVHTIAFKGAKE